MPDALNLDQLEPTYLGPSWRRDENGKLILPAENRTLGWEILGWINTYLNNFDGTPNLKLTPEQRARWEGMETPFLHDLSSNWSDIRRHREALVRHIFADAPERTAIDAEQAAIARLQAAQQQRVIDQLLAERAMLDDAQRTRLLQLLLTRYAEEATEEEMLHRK